MRRKTYRKRVAVVATTSTEVALASLVYLPTATPELPVEELGVGA
jgi:hypothetical protein